MPLTTFEKKVYVACRRIPRGKVSTYAEIARAIGRKGAARAVGNVLNKNPFATVPCHRVVCSDGKIGGYAHGERAKEKILKREGVEIKSGKVKDFQQVFKKL